MSTEQSLKQSTLSLDPIIIIGTGPCGIRVLDEIHQKLPTQKIIIFGDEPWHPYNRVRLSTLLAGEVNKEEIETRSDALESKWITHECNNKIICINRQDKTVTDSNGNQIAFSRLIISTGSSAFLPDIEGIHRKGVYTFRTMKDTEHLIARRSRSHKTVIVGGGLLGLEAARAMQKYNTEVTVLEHGSRLMSRQLDETGSAILLKQAHDMNISTLLNERVVAIEGNGSLDSITLASGKKIDCDTLIVAAGITPNIELAKEAKLAYSRGITVNDYMQTSDPDIYAIGECCEHNGQVYGIVAPGFEQAVIAAANICGEDYGYEGTVLATSLKVAGLSVFSMGEVDTNQVDITSYHWQDGDDYRRLNIKHGKIVGVCSIGDWPELTRIREQAKKGALIYPWQLWRFKFTGNLWPEGESQYVASWPDETIICNCNGISKGQLCKEITAGADCMQSVAEKTQATTVCGSCKPLISELLGGVEILPEPGYRTLISSSFIIFLLGVIAWLYPGIPYNDTVQMDWRWDQLWTESLYKQISGFTLLGLTVIVSLLSVRKRLDWDWLQFPTWRVIHVLVGGSCLAGLIIHTGFRLGSNLNFYLMMCFTGLIVVGTLVATVIAMEHKMSAGTARQIRSMSFWVHLLLFWPVPFLLWLHVFKTYYY